MKFTVKELKQIKTFFQDRGIPLDQLNQAYVVSCGLIIAKKDLNLGNRIGMTKATDLESLLSQSVVEGEQYEKHPKA